MFQITTDPIDPHRVEAAVKRDEFGAMVAFAGIVRNHAEGKPVAALEYEAYREMAEQKLAEIGTEVRERWPETQIAILHRIGHLDIGETSVVIAVAAPHRREAFAACEYAIDRVKVIVPIWKKEIWRDGGQHWVGAPTPSAANP